MLNKERPTKERRTWSSAIAKPNAEKEPVIRQTARKNLSGNGPNNKAEMSQEQLLIKLETRNNLLIRKIKSVFKKKIDARSHLGEGGVCHGVYYLISYL